MIFSITRSGTRENLKSVLPVAKDEADLDVVAEITKKQGTASTEALDRSEGVKIVETKFSSEDVPDEYKTKLISSLKNAKKNINKENATERATTIQTVVVQFGGKDKIDNVKSLLDATSDSDKSVDIEKNVKVRATTVKTIETSFQGDDPSEAINTHSECTSSYRCSK